MSKWTTTPLGELVDILDSKRVPLSAAQRSLRKGPFPYYGAQGVIDYIDDYIFDGRYILVPEDGENLRSRKLPIAYFAEGRFWVNNHAHIIKSKPGTAEDRFIQSALEAAHIGTWVTGAAQPKLSQANLKKIPLLVPDIEEQRTIGAVLDAMDDLIENNRRRVAVLEEMARAIYREWFVKFRYPGHEDVPFVDSALGPIPEGWSTGIIDDIVTVSKASVDPATLDPETPAIGLEHIPRQQITLDDWGKAGSQGSRKAVFEKGDVLFGKIRPYFHKVSVAPVDGICSTDAIVIRPHAAHWGQAVFTASSAEFVTHATQTSNGTKMPRADWKVLGKWSLAVPPTRLAELFSDIARHHLALAETLMFENRRLATMRDLLLPKLVTGQIDVSALDLNALVSTGSTTEGGVGS